MEDKIEDMIIISYPKIQIKGDYCGKGCRFLLKDEEGEYYCVLYKRYLKMVNKSSDIELLRVKNCRAARKAVQKLFSFEEKENK